MKKERHTTKGCELCFPKVCTSASKDLSQHRPDCELRNPIRKIKCYATVFGWKETHPMVSLTKPTNNEIKTGKEYGYHYYQATLILDKEIWIRESSREKLELLKEVLVEPAEFNLASQEEEEYPIPTKDSMAEATIRLYFAKEISLETTILSLTQISNDKRLK